MERLQSGVTVRVVSSCYLKASAAAAAAAAVAGPVLAAYVSVIRL